MTRVLVVGASRGIGHELVRQYREEGCQVTATARAPEDLARLHALGAEAVALDVTDTAGIAGLSWLLDGEKLTTAIVTAGLYGPRSQRLDAPSDADFDAVMHTNVLAPMRLLPLIGEVMAPGGRLALLTSRMGSIGARAGHDGWLYRASKAAANSVLKDVSLALEGRATCVALHPGWVRTDMGGDDADITVGHSARDLRALLARLTPADNGRFLNHDGESIAW